MGIVHIVLVEFKPDVQASEILDICHRLVALKEKCLHTQTNKPYVKSGMGGKDNNPEGLQAGITHAFVAEFENEADRKYYLEQDPAHLEFVKRIGAVVARIQVVDFCPGVYE